MINYDLQPVEKAEKAEKVDKAEKSSTTKSKRGKKRKASEISTNPEDQSNDSLENKQIPISDPVFQQKLFHLIVLMMKAFQVRCTDEELSNTYEYMKEILTTERLKNLHQHMTTSESEDDFLSFLSFFLWNLDVIAVDPAAGLCPRSHFKSQSLTKGNPPALLVGM